MRINFKIQDDLSVQENFVEINPVFQIKPFNLSIPLGLTNGDDVYAVQDPAGEKVYGFDGADKITGGSGNDLLNGGTGSDILYGGLGNDELWGGPGLDRDFLYGNDGSDKLYGEQGNDYLDGGAGNDMLDAGAGDDEIYGGSGSDEIWGQSGNDTIDAGADNDRIYAGDGADIIHGGLGDDVINAGNQNDVLYGDEGKDELWGGAGDDTLYGGDGDDRLYGEIGNDILDGGAGYNVLSGGSGNDTYYSKGSYDEMWGGGGYDTYKLNPVYFYALIAGLPETNRNTNVTAFEVSTIKTKMIFEDSEGGLIDLTNYLTAKITVTLKKTSGDQLILTATNGETIVVNGWATGKISFKVGNTPYSIWDASSINTNLAISKNKEMTIVNPNASISVVSLPSFKTNYSALEQQLNTPLKNVLAHFEAKRLQETDNIQNTDAVEIANAKYSNISVDFWKHKNDWLNVAQNETDYSAKSSIEIFSNTSSIGPIPALGVSEVPLLKNNMELKAGVDTRLTLLSNY